jgi:2-polyprenyl-6-methoxyphenol hydroxylase-like FAD-dependent oxidoreductase
MTDASSPSADVVVIGAGMAGASAAFAAARLGLAVTVVDNRPKFPDLFRCEKLTEIQQRLLADVSLADAFLAAGTRSEEVLIGRSGRIVERRAIDERGISYKTMVETVRSAWPASVKYVEGSAMEVVASPTAPAAILSDGRRVEGRLLVLASGNDQRLHATLGISKANVREAFSTAIGFNLALERPQEARFRTLTYWGEKPGDGIAFAALFPIGELTRVNFFCYLDPASPSLKGFGRDPLDRLGALLPGLRPLTAGARVVGKPDIRQVTLHESANCARDGVVLIGDAYRVCCPVTGMGVTRLLTDVRQLVQRHLPAWIAANDFSAARMAEFYADPEKRRADRDAEARGDFLKRLSTQTTLPWRLRRALPGIVGRVRGWRNIIGPLSPAPGEIKVGIYGH